MGRWWESMILRSPTTDDELVPPDTSHQDVLQLPQDDGASRMPGIASKGDESRRSSISFLHADADADADADAMDDLPQAEVDGVDVMVASAMNGRMGAISPAAVESSQSSTLESPTRAIAKKKIAPQPKRQSSQRTDEQSTGLISSTHGDMQDTERRLSRPSTLAALQVKRVSVLSMRLRVQEHRDVVKRHRVTLMNHDAKLLQTMRRLALGYSADAMSELLEPLAQSQKAREELQALENEYDAMEDELSRAEWNMKEAEIKAYDSGFLVEAFPTSRAQSLSRTDSFNSEINSVTTTAPGYQATLRKRYLSRKGDAALLLEELGELQADRARYVEDERVLEPMGLHVSSEGQQVLDTFNARHVELLDTLKRIHEDVADLQERMIYQDDLLFMAHLGAGPDNLDRGHESGLSRADDIELPPNNESLAGITDRNDALLKPEAAIDFVIFALETAFEPSLLAGEGARLAFVRLFYTPVDDRLRHYSEVNLKANEGICIFSFVNRWLENILRRSRVECVALSNHASHRNPEIPYNTLAALSQMCWDCDGTEPRYAKDSERSMKSISAASEKKVTVRSVRSDSNIAREGRLRHRFRSSTNLTSGTRMNGSLMLLRRLRPPLLRRLSRKSRIKDLDKSISIKTSP